MIHSPEIYRSWNFAFGDQWASINLTLQASIARQQRIRLSHNSHGVDLGPLHREIIAELDSDGEIELVPDPPTHGFDGYNVWQTPFFPTRNRWNPREPHPLITVQLDGVSSPQKNPPPSDHAEILNFLTKQFPGRELVHLGKHMTVRECVLAACNSEVFVGVDSGMSHLCHSVGVPLFLIEYDLPTVTTHNGKPHFLCRGTGDFLSRLGRWNAFQSFLLDGK